MPPIIVDSREKRPYRFSGHQTIRENLDVGDYTFDGYQSIFAVERKSLDDLARSLGTDRKRFEDEIKRAQNLEKFVVVVEGNLQDIYKFSAKVDKMKGGIQRSDGPYYSKIHPNAILGTLNSWPDKYEKLDFNWKGSRRDAKQEVLRLLDKWFLLYSSGSGSGR